MMISFLQLWWRNFSSIFQVEQILRKRLITSERDRSLGYGNERKHTILITPLSMRFSDEAILLDCQKVASNVNRQTQEGFCLSVSIWVNKIVFLCCVLLTVVKDSEMWAFWWKVDRLVSHVDFILSLNWKKLDTPILQQNSVDAHKNDNIWTSLKCLKLFFVVLEGVFTRWLVCVTVIDMELKEGNARKSACCWHKIKVEDDLDGDCHHLRLKRNKKYRSESTTESRCLFCCMYVSMSQV